MKKLEMNNYESPLFKVYEIQVKRPMMQASVEGGSIGFFEEDDDDLNC